MKVIFRADDGKIFESADECVKYEQEQKNGDFIQQCWNFLGEELDEESFSEAMFAVQDGDFPDCDFLPNERGRFIWFGDQWVKVEEIEDTLSKMKDILNDGEKS